MQNKDTNNNNVMNIVSVKKFTRTKLLVSLGVIFSFILGMAVMGVLTISDSGKIGSEIELTPLLSGDQVYVCGDMDDSGSIDISDLIYLIDWMHRDGPPPVEPLARANVDGVGDVDIADLIYMIDFMFNNSSEPICNNIIIEHVSPANDVWVETPGEVTFNCQANSTSDITGVSVLVREYYGGWEMNEIIYDEIIDMPGSDDTDFYFSATVDLTNGFYTYQCVATDIFGGSDSSDERKYKTGVGSVYIVHAIDTEPERIASILETINPNPFNIDIEMTSFLPGRNVDIIMDSAWRNQYLDSFGNPNNFYWFMRSDEVICQSNEGCDAVVDYLYLDEAYNYSTEINEYNDTLAWHYHNVEYYDYNLCPPGHNNPPEVCQSPDDIYWNQKMTFNDTIYREKTDVKLAESVFSQFIMDTQMFPVSYRAGWIWQDTDMSNWLEGFMPIDYSNWPNLQSSSYPAQPRYNEYDWSGAPEYPYHPSEANHLTKGNMDRVIVPCKSSVNAQEFFSLASQGTNVIMCYYTHNFGANSMKYGAEGLHSNINNIKSNYPNVNYIYANDIELAKALFKIDDDIMPLVTLELSADQKWLNITSSEELYKPPYLAIQSSDDYYRGELIEVNSMEWKFNIEGLDIVKAAVGGIDLGYNPYYEEISF